jgi:cytochrome c553
MRFSRSCGLYGIFAAACFAQTFRPEIPRAWDDKEVARFQVPLAQRDRTPRYLTSEEYYALRVRPIYRSYPVYAPGREPSGYMESLKQKEPEIVFDASKLRTKEDWIRAGEMVFDAFPTMGPMPPGGLGQAPSGITLPATSEGIILGAAYIVRQKGVLEFGALTSCASCHTRVLPSGAGVNGAQGSFPFEQLFAAGIRQAGTLPQAVPQVLDLEWGFFGAPWVATREEFDKVMTVHEMARRHGAMQPGVVGRHGTSSTHPSHVPSLIGIQDIRYLDATGLMRHRSIGDLMRYAISNYGLDIMAHYGDFQPSKTQTGFAEDGTRFSDEQLYALALYIYSLQPPPNPNRFDDKARRGQRIFQQQGCVGCHTPPLYTNNKLTLAPGFKVPDDLRKSDDIMSISVGTDPTLAMQTRRGTGFYKVPSLRGVWFRNAFGHNGQAETLEEWLDPARLGEGYIPKGFHLGPGPIKGHEFGLKLSPEDKQALIAFLKML